MRAIFNQCLISSVVSASLLSSYTMNVQAAAKCNKKTACISASVGLLLAGAGVGGYFIYKALDDDTTPEPTAPPTPRPTLRPTHSPAPTVSPTSAPTKESLFNIQLVNMGGNNLYDQDFQKAKARWQSVIVNDLPGYPQGTVDDWFAGQFDTPNNDAVDDLIIGYEIRPIDGEGAILGQAGPLYYRSGFTSAISGLMIFDEDDFANMSSEDREIIVLHEMGHVLGIGTFWSQKCGVGCTSGDYEYTCSGANQKYAEAGFTNSDLTLENDGGPGTQCGHWDESSFSSNVYSELMTGYFEANKYQPLSAVTAAALEDLGGYEVDYSATDNFPDTLNTQEAMPGLKPSHTFDLHGRMIDTVPIELN